ncbi:hypothetical protein T05_10101 [Trichinella murrelli]|uniref:Uncharacterized protein n=1 Tax=Trichinella murrelli TaxID=144512 RepID=A0A0V0TF65_9BILA|nr:hypothetical protein T05_10101 [Trichinella murrelli]
MQNNIYLQMAFHVNTLEKTYLDVPEFILRMRIIFTQSRQGVQCELVTFDKSQQTKSPAWAAVMRRRNTPSWCKKCKTNLRSDCESTIL